MRNGLICFITMFAIFAHSCTDYDFGYTIQQIRYENEFTKEFGTPSPKHTWGFIEQPILNYSIPTTRTVNTESNLWGDPNYYGLNVPQDISEEEADYVYNWFATHENPNSEVIHWSDFFIQFVGYSGIGSMDQLGYESMDGLWEHVNDFNTNTNTIKYVYNAGTENWTYRASHSDTYQYNKYNIQHLVFDVNGHHYDGWYVGFDYESIKGDSGDKPSDGYFNDWIVKVTAGTHQGYPISVRVMCEDLGGSFDWDFNDVVFDVSFKTEEVWWPAYSKKTFATVILRACGGSLKIYVGKFDENYEAHKLLGDGTLEPLPNPGKIAVYTYEVENTTNSHTMNAKNVPIYVVDEETQATYEINTSAIPQKFACPDDVEWVLVDTENICEKYPNVPHWVQDEDMADGKNVWELNPHRK